MAKPAFVELAGEIEIPILYEDRSVLAMDKPAGWMLVPSNWDRTARNLQLAIDSSIRGREFWASSRNLKFLRFVHRLDAETTGVILFAKSPGAVSTFSRLFQGRAVRKVYLAVVEGAPKQAQWECSTPVAEDTQRRGLMRLDRKAGKESLTGFNLLQSVAGKSLVRAEPVTGRTHQIRLHLSEARLPIVGDQLYGKRQQAAGDEFPIGLRAIELGYADPFTRRPVNIRAPWAHFVCAFGFDEATVRAALAPVPAAKTL